MKPNRIAPHVVTYLVSAQLLAQPCTLASLTRALGVRRADVRRTVSALHRDGYVDALRMRLTLKGLALGMVLCRYPLSPLRRTPAELKAAA